MRTAKDLFGVDLHRGTLASLGLPDASFDVVANFNLMSHLYAPWDYLKEVRRILADDGVLLIRTGLRDGVMKFVAAGSGASPSTCSTTQIGCSETCCPVPASGSIGSSRPSTPIFLICSTTLAGAVPRRPGDSRMHSAATRVLPGRYSAYRRMMPSSPRDARPWGEAHDPALI